MDVRLKWDPSEFGNIKELYTNSSLIWTPKFGWVNMWVLRDKLRLRYLLDITSRT